MHFQYKHFILALFLSILTIPVSCFAQQGWKDGWKYRLTVAVPESEDKSPVEKAVLLDFFGKAKEDGSDIRITDLAGREIPVFIVSAGKENRYQVAFPGEAGGYFLYSGNDSAESPGYNWRPQRGLLLEVYERKGNDIRDWDRVKDIIEKSRKGKLVGRGFREKVWDGTNPFGGEKDTVRIYEGFFYLSAPEKLTFATSSAGPSYITVDGNPVASWEGWHRAEPFVRPESTGEASLKQGLHKFIYYHIGRPWQEIAVAALKQKNKEKFDVIPGNFFLPLAKASVEKAESYGKKICAGFSWENTNYLKREEWELLTFRFRDISFPEEGIKEWIWSFGDGQEASGKDVYHTYILGGKYPVTLKARDKEGNSDEITLNVYAGQDFSMAKIMPLERRQYLEELGRFNLNSLKNDALFSLAGIYESYGLADNALKVYQALDKRSLNREERKKVGLASAALYQERGENSAAEQVYRSLLSRKPEADIFLKLGALFVETGELEKAEAQYLKVLETKSFDEESRRKALSGMGDIWRVKGDYEKALETYEKASAQENREMQSGAFAQSVISCLRIKDSSAAYEQLMLWAEKLPDAKLSGNWSVLLARAHMMDRKYKKAADELEIFIKIADGRENLYLPAALFLAGEAYEQMGNKEKARDFYRTVIEKYPSSSVFSQAQKKLEGL
ncbi:MAG TPA: tetratricopeptide repeat protein [bacterium]|nr:tetratricopeptide repeat protein [bacterium]